MKRAQPASSTTAQRQPALGAAGYGRRALALLAVAIVALLLAASPAAGSAIIDREVSFDVHNTNSSPVACESDGQQYTVRGHLVAPAEALRGGAPNAVTVYLYGFETGEFQWRLRAVPGHDFARRMAGLGHASVTVDMLGYDTSGHPDGFHSCMGSQADVAHQIVDQLRAGSYQSSRSRPTFERVALAGHDVAGGMAEIVAYAYGGVDALLVLTWADTAPGVGFSPYIMSLFAEGNVTCATRPERAEGTSGPGGYFFLAGSDEDYRANIFWDTEPAVIDAAVALRNRNPCGYLDSIPPMVFTNIARLGEIDVPVLAVMGAEDPVFMPGTMATQRLLFTGSDDITTVTMENAGHFPMLGRAASRYAALIADWLAQRGF